MLFVPWVLHVAVWAPWPMALSSAGSVRVEADGRVAATVAEKKQIGPELSGRALTNHLYSARRDSHKCNAAKALSPASRWMKRSPPRCAHQDPGVSTARRNSTMNCHVASDQSRSGVALFVPHHDTYLIDLYSYAEWGSEPSSALFPFCYLSAGQRRASTPATELGAATNPTRACNLRSTPRAKINHRSAAAFASHHRAGKVSQRFTRVTGARARSYAARGDRERARSP
ncbi:unnamed protein product [Lampetra fluviatilis]